MSSDNKSKTTWADVFRELVDGWGPILAIIILVTALNYKEVVHFFHTEFKSDISCSTNK